MKLTALFCAAIFCLFISALPAQESADSIIFLNGEVRAVKVVDTAFNQIRFIPMNKKPNSKPRILDAAKDRVFSIKFASGEEKIIYFYDSAIGNVFTVLEARMFILGEQEAERNYKNCFPFWGGLAIGILSPVVLADAVVLAPIPPAIAPLSTLLPKIRVNTKAIANKNYLQYDTYIMGYERVARKKNFLNMLAGAGAGLAAGMGVWWMIK